MADPRQAPPGIRIEHLFRVPWHRLSAAALIHHEFWTAVPGASVERMDARLAQAASADCVPLSLVALRGEELVGVVNLVANDSELRSEWTPWLAGMVVAAPWRAQGIGSALVRALLADARRLRVARLHLGTDGPGFYTRLGARIVEPLREDFWYLAFDLE